ncbi:MAG: alpha/beta-hydrolase family protein [Actinobacteria bacterium]|nr:alpha/beta-hydrolase family protein [Actinomycetota bacterium]
MAWPRIRLPERLVRYTTDTAVRVGILHAASSIGPSYSRGLLPRSPTQQAMIVGIDAAVYYMVGTTTWLGITSVYAGLPGRRAGWRAKLAGAAITGVTGKVGEIILRPRSGQSVPMGVAWSTSRFLGSVGLAGGIVTLNDTVYNQRTGHSPGVLNTIAVDVAGGAAMAAGSTIRRELRLRKYGAGSDRPTIDRHKMAAKGKTGEVMAEIKSVGISAATVGIIGAVALAEQTAVRAIVAAANRFVGHDTGEVGELAAHCVTALGLGALGVYGLNTVRKRTTRENDVHEPAYPNPPTSEYVSCGPKSVVNFEDIGKEGRRFVLMVLDDKVIENVIDEPAINPIRIVIPRQGAVDNRVQQCLEEMDRLGAFDRDIIVLAAPTGVGYVNYVMAEALEYLSRGNCATIVPQYALRPSALALDSTDLGTQLQGRILEAISDRIEAMPTAKRPRLVQFGESLGAQVALDVAAEGGIHRLDTLDVEAGLYMGVPFRSKTWRAWRRNARSVDPGNRLVLVSRAEDIPHRPGQHVMIVHDDDPVNKFGYRMLVKRPWYLGPPKSRPPMVPRETLFRPVVSFVIALVDLVNGMNMKPGDFRRVGHDYRIDIREALQETFVLEVSPEQAEAIEAALREREQEWAEKRLVYRAFDKAARNVVSTLNKWGKGNVSIDLPDADDVEAPDSFKSFAQMMANRAQGLDSHIDSGG